MKKQGMTVLGIAAFLLMMLAVGCQDQPSTAPDGISNAATASSLAKGGFDEFGYNYQARLFNGIGDGYDRVLDGKVGTDPKYANDKLVMKWSKAWDDARFNGAPWGPDAWVSNEWNGKVPGGSGETDHVKIVWVGPLLESSPYWRPGGEPIWGEFEIIMEQGQYGSGHEWLVKANPAGYGIYK